MCVSRLSKDALARVYFVEDFLAPEGRKKRKKTHTYKEKERRELRGKEGREQRKRSRNPMFAP